MRVPPIIARNPGAMSANRGAPRSSNAVKPWISLAPTSRSGSISVVQLAISSPQGESLTRPISTTRSTLGQRPVVSTSMTDQSVDALLRGHGSADDAPRSSCCTTPSFGLSVSDPATRPLIVDLALYFAQAFVGRFRRPGHDHELVVGDRLDSEKLGWRHFTATLEPRSRRPPALVMHPPAALLVEGIAQGEASAEAHRHP